MTDMKKIFNIFITALLCAALSFVSCENANVDDNSSSQPANTTPEWPTVIEAEVLAGEVYTLNINPNVDWVLTIPETMAAYFQTLARCLEVPFPHARRGRKVPFSSR